MYCSSSSSTGAVSESTTTSTWGFGLAIVARDGLDESSVDLDKGGGGGAEMSSASAKMSECILRFRRWTLNWTLSDDWSTRSASGAETWGLVSLNIAVKISAQNKPRIRTYTAKILLDLVSYSFVVLSLVR